MLIFNNIELNSNSLEETVVSRVFILSLMEIVNLASVNRTVVTSTKVYLANVHISTFCTTR